MLRHAAALAVVDRSVAFRWCRRAPSGCRSPTASFDLACSAFGAVPFVAEPERVMREVARVLRPGGRWVFAVNHPMRWMFSDDPGPDGLVVQQSYFDRTPYVEVDATGAATYVEHHRTLGDRVRDIVAAGLVLDDLIEPEWPEGRETGVGPVVPAARARCSRAPSCSPATSREDARAHHPGPAGGPGSLTTAARALPRRQGRGGT